MYVYAESPFWARAATTEPDLMGFFPDNDDWADLVTREMRTRRLTLDEHYAPSMELVRKGHVAQSDLDQGRAMLEVLAKPGDEWWEWIMGTEPLMQVGGLALVRAGQIIWARNVWIS